LKDNTKIYLVEIDYEAKIVNGLLIHRVTLLGVRTDSRLQGREEKHIDPCSQWGNLSLLLPQDLNLAGI
jgi:hypothetical protein